MSESQVAETAQRFFDAQEQSHQKERGKPSILFGLKVMHVRPDPDGANKWLVLFSSRKADGGVIDSPPMVLVDDTSGEACFLPEFGA